MADLAIGRARQGPGREHDHPVRRKAEGRHYCRGHVRRQPRRLDGRRIAFDGHRDLLGGGLGPGRHADGGGEPEPRHPLDRLLDLARSEGRAAALQQGPLAAEDVEVPVRIEPADIPRVQPAAAANARALGLRRLEITGEDGGAAHQDLPRRAGLPVDPHLDPWDGAATGDVAAGIDPQRLAGPQSGHAQGRLREAIAGPHRSRHAEALLELHDRAPPHRLAAIGGVAERREIEPLGIDEPRRRAR